MRINGLRTLTSVVHEQEGPRRRRARRHQQDVLERVPPGGDEPGHRRARAWRARSSPAIPTVEEAVPGYGARTHQRALPRLGAAVVVLLLAARRRSGAGPRRSSATSSASGSSGCPRSRSRRRRPAARSRRRPSRSQNGHQNDRKACTKMPGFGGWVTRWGRSDAASLLSLMVPPRSSSALDDRPHPARTRSRTRRPRSPLLAPAGAAHDRRGRGLGIVLAVCGIGYAIWRFSQLRTEHLNLAKASSGGPQNYLIVGSDTRAGISKSDPRLRVFNGDNQAPTGQRSDTIMVLRIDPSKRHGQAAVVPPRPLDPDLRHRRQPTHQHGLQQRTATAHQHDREGLRHPDQPLRRGQLRRASATS